MKIKKLLKALSIETGLLESDNLKQRESIVEAAFLLAMWRNPKLNAGSKEELVKRTDKFIEDSEVFPEKTK